MEAGISCVLVIFAGIMSGLTLGLMSLGLVDLEILQRSGTPSEKKQAVVQKQHQLLATFLELLILCMVVGILTLGTAFLGYASITMMYGYLLLFDFLRCLGHCNVEVFPHRLFDAIHILKYLIYTPTYHSLHHTEMRSNFCLFMPLYDKLWNTIDAKYWDSHQDICSRTSSRVPNFVFLAHVVDVISAMHAPFIFRSFSLIPFSNKLFLFPMWPYSFWVMLIMWVKSKTFLFSFYNLRGKLHQTWAVPRFGFQDITKLSEYLRFIGLVEILISTQVTQLLLETKKGSQVQFSKDGNYIYTRGRKVELHEPILPYTWVAKYLL